MKVEFLRDTDVQASTIFDVNATEANDVVLTEHGWLLAVFDDGRLFVKRDGCSDVVILEAP